MTLRPITYGVLVLIGGILPSSPLAEAQLLPNLGGQRVGISTFQFLKMGVGARGVAAGRQEVLEGICG